MQINYNEQVLNPAQVIQHPDGSSHLVGEVCPTGQCDGYGNPIQITPFSQGVLPSAEDIQNNYSTDNVRWLQAIADKRTFGVKFNNANEINDYYDKQAINRMRRTPEWNQSFNLRQDQFGSEGAALAADQDIAYKLGLNDSMYNVGQTTTNADAARTQLAAMNARADLLNSDPDNTNMRFARDTGIRALTPYTNNNGDIVGITDGLSAKSYSPDPTDRASEQFVLSSPNPTTAYRVLLDNSTAKIKAAIAPTITADSRVRVADINKGAKVTTNAATNATKVTTNAATNVSKEKAAEIIAKQRDKSGGTSNVSIKDKL
jgi:hypothetical protein